jgi:hypothetical protein
MFRCPPTATTIAGKSHRRGAPPRDFPARSDSPGDRRACCQRSSSGRFAAVALEQSAESLFTADFAQRNDLVFQVAAFRFQPPTLLGPTEELILDPVALVRTFLVIVFEIRGVQAIQVLRAEDHEPIEAFLFDGLNESLDEGIRVGRTVGVLHGFHPAAFQFRVERLGKLGIAVVLHHRDWQVLGASLANERFGLRDDPRFIGMQRGWRQDDLPRFHVQKCKDKGFANSLQREHSLREKVALPERPRVLLEKLIPRSFAAFRAGIETGVLENAFHRVPREGMNAEFFQLAKNPGVAPLVLLGQFENQLADLFRCATAAAFHGRFFAGLLFRPNPAQQRVGRDDGRQFAQGLTPELLREPDQPRPFLGGYREAFRQPAPQGLVLDLEVFDLAGQFFLRRAGDDQQQGVKYVRHRARMRKRMGIMEMDSFWHCGRRAMPGETYATVDATTSSATESRALGKPVCQFRGWLDSLRATESDSNSITLARSSRYGFSPRRESLRRGLVPVYCFTLAEPEQHGS